MSGQRDMGDGVRVLQLWLSQGIFVLSGTPAVATVYLKSVNEIKLRRPISD